MFYHGYVLNSVDLTNFDTSEVTDMSNMFYTCYKIKYLNLSSFNTSKVKTISQMFYECKSLQYLDIKKFVLNNGVSKNKAFYLVPDLTRYCIEESEQGINLINSTKNIICSDTCYNETSTIIDRVNNKCVEICDNDTFIYYNFCLEESPINTHIKKYTINICEDDECILDNKTLCIENTPKGYYFDMNDSYYKKCYNKCDDCYGAGNEYNNNCSECKSGLKLINDFGGIYNCYEFCPFFLLL